MRDDLVVFGVNVTKKVDQFEDSLVLFLFRFFGRTKPAAGPHIPAFPYVWAPTMTVFRWGVYVGIAQWRVDKEGARYAKPQPGAALALQFRPFDWRRGSQHDYYDGPLCTFFYGPIWLSKEWWSWCTQCVPVDACASGACKVPKV